MTPPSYVQDERRARSISGLVTLLALLLFFLIAYLWVIVRGTIPPQDENPYIVAGRIDFGYTQAAGSPSPKAPSSLAEESPITTPEPSPVKIPHASKSAKRSPSPTTPPTNAEESDEEETETFESGGRPDASQPGDLGQGLLEWGEGEEGLQNRRLMYFVAPRYTVQKEARIKFELFVQPDGSVSRARALNLQAPPELRQAGEEAIRQWRFSPIAGNQVQRITVTIRFRLR
ncbi:MAG: hypothetical protein KatS3mg025_1826 [Bacteroidia bacterium]|nr:MAG: hypothetical protein KatS3mg025_1826 [Bacteroidia bacterium]